VGAALVAAFALVLLQGRGAPHLAFLSDGRSAGSATATPTIPLSPPPPTPTP
jgi:hypothetical protein